MPRVKNQTDDEKKEFVAVAEAVNGLVAALRSKSQPGTLKYGGMFLEAIEALEKRYGDTSACPGVPDGVLDLLTGEARFLALVGTVPAAKEFFGGN